MRNHILTDMDAIRAALDAAKIFGMDISDLQRAAAYSESPEEFRRVVDEMAVALDG